MIQLMVPVITLVLVLAVSLGVYIGTRASINTSSECIYRLWSGAVNDQYRWALVKAYGNINGIPYDVATARLEEKLAWEKEDCQRRKNSK